jgi:hypothetical protein
LMFGAPRLKLGMSRLGARIEEFLDHRRRCVCWFNLLPDCSFAPHGVFRKCWRAA